MWQIGNSLNYLGGRIDHGHHDGYAARALDETVEFSKAIDLARKRTSEEDTLIVVTSDHSHTMSISGYSVSGAVVVSSETIQSDMHKMHTKWSIWTIYL